MFNGTDRERTNKCTWLYAFTYKNKCIKVLYIPTMMAVDLYSGLKGQRLRPSSITTSPTSSLSSVNVDVFWKWDTNSENVFQAPSNQSVLKVKSELKWAQWPQTRSLHYTVIHTVPQPLVTWDTQQLGLSSEETEGYCVSQVGNNLLWVCTACTNLLLQTSANVY